MTSLASNIPYLHSSLIGFQWGKYLNTPKTTNINEKIIYNTLTGLFIASYTEFAFNKPFLRFIPTLLTSIALPLTLSYGNQSSYRIIRLCSKLIIKSMQPIFYIAAAVNTAAIFYFNSIVMGFVIVTTWTISYLNDKNALPSFIKKIYDHVLNKPWFMSASFVLTSTGIIRIISIASIAYTIFSSFNENPPEELPEEINMLPPFQEPSTQRSPHQTSLPTSLPFIIDPTLLAQATEEVKLFLESSGHPCESLSPNAIRLKYLSTQLPPNFQATCMTDQLFANLTQEESDFIFSIETSPCLKKIDTLNHFVHQILSFYLPTINPLAQTQSTSQTYTNSLIVQQSHCQNLIPSARNMLANLSVIETPHSDSYIKIVILALTQLTQFINPQEIPKEFRRNIIESMISLYQTHLSEEDIDLFFTLQYSSLNEKIATLYKIQKQRL